VFCEFNHSAGWWRCNLCKFENPLPPQYQGNYNSMYGGGAQPELSHGSVEFEVQGPYISRPAQEPITLFAVDVSTAAIQTASSGIVLRAIRRILFEHKSGQSRLMGDQNAKVGILTYSDTVRFYDIYAPTGGSHKVLIMSDAQEGFCPLPPNRLVMNVDEHFEAFDALLEALLVDFGSPKLPIPGQQPGQGPPNVSLAATAFQAGVNGLELCGGKLIFCIAQMPNFGAGTDKLRKENPQWYSSASESGMYTVDKENESLFTNLTMVCCEKQISVDVYAFGDDHKDLASWSLISNNTGGEIRRFPNFNLSNADAVSEFHEVLEHNVRRRAALEAVLKVRASQGIRVDEYYGTGLKRTKGGELDMAFIDEDNASIVVLQHDGTNLENVNQVYLQCAVLHTNVEGKRRVRVHNVALSVTNAIADVFRNADVDAIANYLALRAVDKVTRNAPLQQVHGDMNQAVVKMLSSYRTNCAKNPTGQQLILPEALKLLPLYTVSAQKMPALRKNTEGLKSHRSAAQRVLVRADERVGGFNFLMRSSLRTFINYTYPALYALDSQDTIAVLDEKPNLAPSKVSLEPSDGSVLFLCNGVDTLLVILPGSKPGLISQLTGLPNYSALQTVFQEKTKPVKIVAKPESSPFMEMLVTLIRRELVYRLASAKALLDGVRILAQKGIEASDLDLYLVEDSQFDSRSMPAYDDFLCSIHSSIQTTMSS